MSGPAAPAPPVVRVRWPKAYRIIRSRFPPIDLFEDIADPVDWDVLARGEMKTNPRFEETVGKLSLVAPSRRVGGPGASYVMAPFTHVSADHPSRFADGTFGAYYAGDSFEVAVAETIHHHERFMRSTHEPAGWTSDFRELVGQIDAELHDLCGQEFEAALEPDSYAMSRALARSLRTAGSDGVLYPSVRHAGGACVAAFYPDVVGVPAQGRHLSYHWDGARVDQIQDVSNGKFYAVA